MIYKAQQENSYQNIEHGSKMFRYARSLGRAASFFHKIITSRKPVGAYVGGWTGKQNLGDEALFEATRRLFHRYELIQFNGSKTQLSLSRHFHVYRDGILAGGTLINRIDDWLRLTRQYLNVAPNLFLFGTGVANPTFWAGKWNWVDRMKEWEQILQKCCYVGVRGPLSAELLYDAGIKNVEVIGDPVLVFSKNSVKSDYIPNTIGLNIGQDKGRHWGDEEKICEEYIKLAKLAKEAKWKVKWLVVFPKDVSITRKAAILSNTDQEIVEIYDNAEKYIEAVRPLSTFVGMKLHATVLATCAIVPSIMLEYRPKCLDYMKSIGHEKFTFRTDEFRAKSLWEIILSWNERRSDVAETLCKSINWLSEKQRKKAEYLMDSRLGNFKKSHY
jgi:hypothetical protein